MKGEHLLFHELDFWGVIPISFLRKFKLYPESSVLPSKPLF